MPANGAIFCQISSVIKGSIGWAKNVIIGVRNVRGEMNISPAKDLPIYMARGDATAKRRLEENRQFLSKLRVAQFAGQLFGFYAYFVNFTI